MNLTDDCGMIGKQAQVLILVPLCPRPVTFVLPSNSMLSTKRAINRLDLYWAPTIYQANEDDNGTDEASDPTDLTFYGKHGQLNRQTWET